MSGNYGNKLRDLELSLTYDDIIIKPNYSNVKFTDIDLSLRLTEKIILKLPIFSAAMDTLTGPEMARAMILSGCVGTLHKNEKLEVIVETIRKLKEEFGDTKPITASVGAKSTPEELKAIVEAGANVLVVDSAHGHTERIGDIVEHITKNYPDVFLIAGNVVTKEGAIYLMDKGAKGIKVGIGEGSICTTRQVTGVGRGQVSSLTEVADVTSRRGVLTIADGGIRTTAEIMKAIACGADAVMLGNMLSGCDECPGELVEIDGVKYKKYRGMGSKGAIQAGSDHNLSNSKYVSEGIEGLVKAKGSVTEVLFNIEWSLRSAFGYVGALNIEEAKNLSQFVRTTQAVVQKADYHSIDKVIGI